MSQQDLRQAFTIAYPEGSRVTGRITSIADYGCFIDLPNQQKGILHQDDMSWQKTFSKTADHLKVDDDIELIVLSGNSTKKVISLGLKQCSPNPWHGALARYPAGVPITTTVIKIADFGIYVTVEKDMVGFVHVTELDWFKQNSHPSRLVTVGDTIDVVVLSINEERQRFDLSVKQCTPNPWLTFAKTHKVGDCVLGKVYKNTVFGYGVELENGLPATVDTEDQGTLSTSNLGDTLRLRIVQFFPENQHIQLAMETDQTKTVGVAAETYKNEGFKCAESVVLALAEKQGVSNDLIPKIATVFCSGMARTCGTCGALTGAMMGISIGLGRSTTTESAEPSHNATRRLIAEFESEFGAKDCHVLLGCDIGTREGQAFFKENNFKQRCTGYTRRAAEIAANILDDFDAVKKG